MLNDNRRRSDVHFDHLTPAIRYGVAILLWLVLIPAPSAWSVSPAVVTFPAGVEVNNDPMTLGDLAEIESEDPELDIRLKTVIIGKAPSAGNTRNISLDYIHLRLKQNHIDLSQLRLSGPPVIEVHRGSIHIPPDQIEMFVKDYLASRPFFSEDHIRISGIDVPQKGVSLPKGDMDVDITPLNPGQSSDIQAVYIHFRVNGSPIKRVLATVRMEVIREVVVTRNPIARNHTISNEDITVLRMNISGLPHDVAMGVDDVVGKMAKRYIGANKVLRSEWIDSPTIVDKGDRVLMVAQMGTLRITAMGEVKKSGRAGERIPVVNLDSKKLRYGKVVDEKTVWVTC